MGSRLKFWYLQSVIRLHEQLESNNQFRIPKFQVLIFDKLITKSYAQMKIMSR